MLNRLYIKNYVIIDELSLDFGQQLNVLTGETGAGKSIIVGALSLILGERADTSVLIKQDQKCIVEATFGVNNKNSLKNIFEINGLEWEDELIIRREINAKGKSRAFVNDSPVVLSVLTEITEQLVDLHRQFDNLMIRDSDFEFGILDAISNNDNLLKDYRHNFKEYKRLTKQYQSLFEEKEAWQKEADYKQFLYDELEQASFQKEELEQTEERLNKMEHAEQIQQVLNGIHYTLEEGEPSILSTIRNYAQQLEAIAKIFPKATELSQRLDSARIELKDIAEECTSLNANMNFNETELQQLQDRLDIGYKLMKKHQVKRTEELLKIFEHLSLEIQKQNNVDEELSSLKKAQDAAFEKVQKLSAELHKQRSKHSSNFEKDVNKLLHLIGMPNANIKIEVEQQEQYNENGNNKIEFLWDANKSGQFQPVQKTASGGELSRIMLCIKTLTAEAVSLPTLIFDEVDTGISGEAARQVGLLLERLSRQHQVFCITHQPQVASRGNTHFFVYKTDKNGEVKTDVTLLEGKERIYSIAQMIGGEQPSDAALSNAKEMIEEGTK